jgi:hypothetical protein
MDDSLHYEGESFEKDQPAAYFEWDAELLHWDFMARYTDQLC